MYNQSEITNMYPVAEYKEQRVPQFKSNKMIEALARPLDGAELFKALTCTPKFHPEQRTWLASERIHMIRELGNFTIPTSKHISLAYTIDSMIRSGYVGRQPRTAEHAKRLNDMCVLEERGHLPIATFDQLSQQLSALLIGVPGTGKSTGVKRVLSQQPNVIYHPESHTYQITYLRIEFADGASSKALARAIIKGIATLIPTANYEDTYLKGDPTADALLKHAKRLLHQHFVGILVADEIQHLVNAPKGKERLMSELVYMCNDLHIPILFIGTNKASQVFSLDFRLARRAVGLNLEAWDRLVIHENQDLSGEVQELDDDAREWNDFLGVLWHFQWVRKPTPLTPQLSSLLYYYSQGVKDIAVKLFAAAQGRAILSGAECITSKEITDAYEREMKSIHPMMDALRSGDLERLVAYEDIAPIGVTEILDKIGRRLRAKGAKSQMTKRGDSTFEPRLAATLNAVGIPEEAAVKMAAEVSAKVLPGTTLIDAASMALKEATPGKPSGNSGTRPVPSPIRTKAIEGRPDDYRNALVGAHSDGASVANRMRRNGHIKSGAEILSHL